MKILKNKPVRTFNVGLDESITIKHTCSIELGHNEQITFLNESKDEYDVVRKSWGFYATPSLNGRLINNNFKSALVKNEKKKIYIMIVEKNKIEDFFNYLKKEKNELIEWLDEKEID